MQPLLQELGIAEINPGASIGGSDGRLKTSGKVLTSVSPIDGRPIAQVVQATAEEYEEVMAAAQRSFLRWRMVPAPKRGEIIREIGDALRLHKEALGRLITLEMGKILTEGQGEVQEMIDIADFALGLSRQLYGLTMHSERPFHRMYEQWHPLGPIGVVTSFNFPTAVWSWNALIAGVCGDPIVWKPSSKTPLCALAVMNIIAPIVDKYDLPGVFNLVIGGGREIGDRLVNDTRLPLISATGSTRMGIEIARKVGARLGRTLLELGGNNAVIVTPSADLEMAMRAVLFGAVGTAGQRCTSTRRLIVHRDIQERFVERLAAAYDRIVIGNPLDPETLMGPLVDEAAVEALLQAQARVLGEGGTIVREARRTEPAGCRGGSFVTPGIALARNEYAVVQEETFAPLLHVIGYDTLEEALAYQNGVSQGLSSAIFTTDMREMEDFLSHRGSDCGIANVNSGTSGAEIGGAFGGEKQTGGGRESGSDAWKIYMRRQTNTINWGRELPLAQNVDFSF